tara:strand:+ start:1288 stop:1536 length:249 start_codon:yes stop_codon:yes gene_type:complete
MQQMKDLALLKICLLGSLLIPISVAAQDEKEEEPKETPIEEGVVVEQKEIIEDAQKKAEDLDKELKEVIELLKEKEATEDPQ